MIDCCGQQGRHSGYMPTLQAHQETPVPQICYKQTQSHPSNGIAMMTSATHTSPTISVIPQASIPLTSYKL
jgi:hypothetical protein